MSAFKVMVEGDLKETTMPLKPTSLVLCDAGSRYSSSLPSARTPPLLMELLEDKLYHKLVNQKKERHDI